MRTKRERITTYWLCPAEPWRNRFAAIISKLAAQFDAPVFEPHVTLYVSAGAEEDASRVLDEVLKDGGPYRLSIRGLDYSEKFTKTLFVQFAPDAELVGLSEELRRVSGSGDDYELNPHLSLIYKKMEQDEKRRLAASIELPLSDVAFDTVKAVISPAQIDAREDVEAWRIVAERKLPR
ncbi:MAG TPA: 2'-5' RNA ligase family protein [Chthoniobacterales bacterium]